MSSKARRPYLMGKKSLVEFYQAPVRYLKEILGKESEFEKPYLEEDYRKMHLDFPWPDWPPFPDFPIPDIPGPEPGLPGCAIVCYEPMDCDEPIWCHPGAWCGTDIQCNLCSWSAEGATKGYTPHPFGSSRSWGIDIWIDTDLVEPGGEALIRTCMTDPCGNVCCHDSEITCEVCPPDIVVSWNSNLNLTIGQGNGGFATVGVAVKDGLGPYSWSVAGTGFSMLHASTEEVDNTLRADATACGTATITVTDFCEDSAIGYVRCTAGQWTGISFTSCVLSGAPDVSGGSVKTEGKYKLTEDWGNAYSVGLPDSEYNGLSNCTEGYNLCARADAKCDKGAPCHADMGCTQCLTNNKCASGSSLCHEVSDCICCGVDSTGGCVCNNPGGSCFYNTKCSRDTSKLEEWTCVP